MKPNPELIGYFLEKDYLVVTNPCKIPLEILEKQLKENKKHPPKNNETKYVCFIKIPFKFKKKTQSKSNLHCKEGKA